jgi:hypothetical protein
LDRRGAAGSVSEVEDVLVLCEKVVHKEEGKEGERWRREKGKEARVWWGYGEGFKVGERSRWGSERGDSTGGLAFLSCGG